MSKQCPLRKVETRTWCGSTTLVNSIFQECIELECAWWIAEFGRCCQVVIKREK